MFFVFLCCLCVSFVFVHSDFVCCFFVFFCVLLLCYLYRFFFFFLSWFRVSKCYSLFNCFLLLCLFLCSLCFRFFLIRFSFLFLFIFPPTPRTTSITVYTIIDHVRKTRKLSQFLIDSMDDEELAIINGWVRQLSQFQDLPRGSGDDSLPETPASSRDCTPRPSRCSSFGSLMEVATTLLSVPKPKNGHVGQTIIFIYGYIKNITLGICVLIV